MNTLTPIPGIETLGAAPATSLFVNAALIAGGIAAGVLATRWLLQKIGIVSKA